MDWATFTRNDVETDALPPLCMVCGEPTTECVNKTFSHTPEWVQYLYFAGFFPGMIAEHFCRKEMRVSCPICARHRNHWSKLVWIASVGWLLAVVVALIAFVAGALIFSIDDSRTIRGTIGGAVVGSVIWLVIVFRLVVTRIRVKAISMTGDKITFERVADAFARAAAKIKAYD